MTEWMPLILFLTLFGTVAYTLSLQVKRIRKREHDEMSEENLPQNVRETTLFGINCIEYEMRTGKIPTEAQLRRALEIAGLKRD